jgi:hypothetical protein
MTINLNFNMERWLAAQPPDFMEAHIALIDALSDYIRSCDDQTKDLVNEGQISPQQAKDGWWKQRGAYRNMLTYLESCSMTGTELYFLLESRRSKR